MKRILLSVMMAVMAAGLAGQAAAQEYEQPEMYWVYREFVKPGMLQEYEAAAKDMIAMLESAGDAAASIRYVGIAGSQHTYSYAIPIEGFSGIDEAWESWGAVVQMVGEEKWAAVETRSSEAVDHGESYVLALREDLSYMPEKTALTAERPFRAYDFWFAIPNKTKEFESVAKEFVSMYRAKGIDHAWRIYEAVTGGDLPMYLLVETAMDQADYYAKQKKIAEMTGEDGMRLYQKALKSARRVEQQWGVVRLDLSFPPPEAASTKD
jgi:hypothetical protein